MTEKKKRGRPRKNPPRKRTQIIPFRDKDGFLSKEEWIYTKLPDGKIQRKLYQPPKVYVFCPETDGLRWMGICNKCELRSKKKSKQGVICWSQSTAKPPQYYNRYKKQ